MVASAHYLDHAATTPLRPEALEAFVAASGCHNPGGQYASGRAARGMLDDARESIAEILHVDPIEVVFTGSGTESDNIALRGLYEAASGEDAYRGIVTSPIEHPAVDTTVTDLVLRHGARVVHAPIDADGRVKVDDIDFTGASVATCMWANNETGALQPVEEFAAAAVAAGVAVHVDATQALGTCPVHLDEVAVTTLAAAAHKFGGPVGCGILAARRSPAPPPILTGGGQERGLRPGTPAVASAAATAAALRAAVADSAARNVQLHQWSQEIIDTVTATISDVRVNTPADPGARLPGIVSLSFPGTEGDSLIMLLDQRGIECSTGSACHSGVNRASHVLLALGADEPTARGTIRISMGHTTTRADIDALLAALPEVVSRARLAGMA